MNSCNQYMDLPDIVKMQWRFTVFKYIFIKKCYGFCSYRLGVCIESTKGNSMYIVHQQWLRVVYIPLRSEQTSEAWKKKLGRCFWRRWYINETFCVCKSTFKARHNKFTVQFLSRSRKKHCVVCDFSLILSVNVGVMVIWRRTRHTSSTGWRYTLIQWCIESDPF